MKKYLLLMIILLASSSLMAKDDIKYNRLSIHLGTPGMTALNYELIIPEVDNKLAVFLNFSYLPTSSDGIKYRGDNEADFEMSSLMIGGGVKYYILQEEEGLFGALEYNYQSISVALSGVDYFEDENVSYYDPSTKSSVEMKFSDASIETSLSMPQLTPKVGYTIVADAGFKFDVELGWNFVFLDDKFLLKSQQHQNQILALMERLLRKMKNFL